MKTRWKVVALRGCAERASSFAMAGDSRRCDVGRSRTRSGPPGAMPGGPSAGRDQIAPSVLGGGPERLDATVQSQLLDEDVVPALVLRDDVRVNVPRPGHALLAGNQHGVQLDALPLVAEDDDVEPHDIHF